MAKRKIIKIDEELCNGCGLCIPNCPEGAMQIIDDKARLISDLFCDGLGACIGHCPQGAIAVEEREAEDYDEKRVMQNIIKQGPNVIKAHLEHLKGHGQKEYLEQAVDFLRSKKIANPLEETKEAPRGHHPHAFAACPGSKVEDFRGEKSASSIPAAAARANSGLRQWPVQIMLVPPFAPYLDHSDLLIAADCVPFAYANFHEDFLKGKTLLVGCPKLDDIEIYRQKFAQILKQNTIKSITYASMEVPCCFGMVGLIEEAIGESGKDIPFHQAVISVKGERIK
jgi:NAD-dependent dihydropyrimidine dehydrogenase PreA subunit